MAQRTSPAERAAELRHLITSGRARELRVHAELSLEVAARECDVTPGAVLRWERGERRPRGRNAVVYHTFLRALGKLEAAS